MKKFRLSMISHVRQSVLVAFVVFTLAGYSLGANLVAFDIPNAVQIFPTDISATGAITGYFIDTNEKQLGFLRKPSGKVVVFDVPANPNDFCNGQPMPVSRLVSQAVGPANLVTGFYVELFQQCGKIHGFTRNNAGVITSFDPVLPDGTIVNITEPQAINAVGQITGWYSTDDLDRSLNIFMHGFFAFQGWNDHDV
jgi:hypothetical protein